MAGDQRGAAAADRNLLKDGGFESRPAGVGAERAVRQVQVRPGHDAEALGGAISAWLECTETGAAGCCSRRLRHAGLGAVVPDRPEGGPAEDVPLPRLVPHRPRLRGHGEVLGAPGRRMGTMQAQALNTQGLWREVRLEGIKPADGGWRST